MLTNLHDAPCTAETIYDEEYFNPIVLHYVKKGAIAESAVLGTEMLALCGERWTADETDYAATASINGSEKSVVCPLCADMHANQALVEG